MERSNAPLPGPAQVLKTGVGYVTEHSGILARVGAIYVALLAGLWTLHGFWAFPDAALQLASVGILAYSSWECHRAFLMGPHAISLKLSMTGPGKREEQKALSKFQLAFVWRAIALIVVVGVVAAAVVLPFILDARLSENQMVGIFLMAMVPLLAILTFPIARLLPVFAALSIKQRLGWLAAWKLSRGAGWRLAVALITIGIVWAALVATAVFLLSDVGLPAPYGLIPLYLAVAVINIFFVAVGSACNAFMFRELTGWQSGTELEVFD